MLCYEAETCAILLLLGWAFFTKILADFEIKTTGNIILLSFAVSVLQM